jgi:hypothetical protein
MRRLFLFASIVVFGGMPHAQADEPGRCCKHHCMIPPPPPCPTCTNPCDHRLTLCVFSPSHSLRIIEELNCEDSCRRIASIKKLGCRLHADFCQEPAVLDALLRALLCDPCWGVRRSAAWSMLGQNARTPPSLLALYISARLDPHYMVRIRAAEALDILTVGKQECYKDLYKSADQLIIKLRTKKYQPGRDCFLLTSSMACGPLDLSKLTPPASAPEKGDTPPRQSEKIPVEKIPLPSKNQYLLSPATAMSL